MKLPSDCQAHLLSYLDTKDIAKIIFCLNKTTLNHFLYSKEDVSRIKELLEKRLIETSKDQKLIRRLVWVWVWRQNHHGHLNTGRHYPTPIKFPTGDVQLSSIVNTNYTTFAIDTQGKLWAWGDNSSGQLGTGDIQERNSPTLINFPEGKQISSIVSRNDSTFAFAIDTQGKLWAWGDNSSGQLGTGDIQERNSPTLINFPEGTQISSIVSRNDSTFAIDTQGKVWAWGINSNGRLRTVNTNIVINSPTQVQFPESTQISSIVSTGLSTFALDTQGKVWAWGNITWLPWRNTTWGETINSIINLPKGTQISSITVGPAVFALDTEGQVWAWGNASEVTLIIDDKEYSTACVVGFPTNANLITLPEGKKISSIFFGTYSVFAIDTEGQVWAWGNNEEGQLGTGDTQKRRSPTLINFPEGTQISSILGISDSTFAIDTQGKLWAWGSGQRRNSPTLIAFPHYSLFSELSKIKNKIFYSKLKKIVEQFKILC